MKTSEALYQQALEQLQRLIDEAGARAMAEPHAAALATADSQARPSVRTVYIVAVEAEGLLFFANRNSGKGHQLIDNPRAALCLFWPVLQEQAIIEGDVLLQSAEVSDLYWHKRARVAQLAAWASEQGAPAPKKPVLRREARQFEHDLGFEPVPRNPDWCAFRIQPDRIEFWPTGWQRMRERTRYQKDSDGQWLREALNP